MLDKIILEIHSDYYKRRKLKKYVNRVIKELKIEILSVKKAEVDKVSSNEFFNGQYIPSATISWKGYQIIAILKTSVQEIKYSCNKLEIDKYGKRISDIDVYYKKNKISRKKLFK